MKKTILYASLMLLAFAFTGSAAWGQSPHTINVTGGGTLTFLFTSVPETCWEGGEVNYDNSQYGGPYSNAFSYKSSTGVVTNFANVETTEINSPGGASCPSDGWDPSSTVVLNAPAGQITFNAVAWTATLTLPGTGVYYPAYKVTSILYSPPGNKGQNGYTDTTSDGATTTVGSTFTYGQSITFTEGFPGEAGGSASEGFGTSITTSSSSAFQETFMDATGVTLANQTSNPDAVNHDLDFFLIWLNPEITVSGYGTTPISYTVSVEPTANGTTPLPDIIGLNAIVMEANSAGKTTIPETWLNQQCNPSSGQCTPGIAKICKNVITAEYNAKTCTLADQCGCAPSDFTAILALDPLLYYNGISKPISPYPGYANPLAANVTAQATCTKIPTPAGSNCRYIPVPSTPGSTLQETLTLAGPDCSWCGTSNWPFQQGENQSTTDTQGFMTEEDVSYSEKAGGTVFSVTETETWKWTQSQSAGVTTGSGVAQTVTLSSATVGCGQDISVFEDTVYHTFLFMQPGPTGSQATSCATATATPTFSPAAGTYTTAQTVTISTSSTGAYIYYTTNGTTPTTSSTLYTVPITVSATETVKAISSIPGWTISAVGSAAYTIE
jgi:hypothetical protein